MGAIGQFQSVTGYGFLARAKERFREDSEYPLDLFVPEELAEHLQFRQGATFVYQPGEKGREFDISLRPRTESDPSRQDNLRRFSVTVRFPNEPGRLNRFLREANKRKIWFQSIRTFGYRSADDSDLIFEGCVSNVPDGVECFVKRAALLRPLGEAIRESKADFLRSDELHIASCGNGHIGADQYILSLPVVGGRFRRLELSTKLEGLCQELRGRLSLVRLIADFGTGSLRVDTKFCSEHHYLVTATCKSIKQATPLTHYILKSLDRKINVDAISGIEFVGRGAAVEDGGMKAIPTGELELLCTAAVGINEAEQEAKAREAVAQAGVEDFKVEIKSLETLLEAERLELAEEMSPGARPDVAYEVMRRQLNQGRYSFVEKLGEGSFGFVSKYLDTKLARMVAVKRFKYGEVREDEILALNSREKDRRRDSRKSHVLELYEIYFDAMEPVLVTECLDFCLEDHDSNPGAEYRERKTVHPASLIEFVDMSMQLLKGLEELQGTRESDSGSRRYGDLPGESQASAVKFIHCDVKPGNIGAVKRGGTLNWKLLDLGLAKAVRNSPESSHWFAGTYEYMSPQALKGSVDFSTDIYSLGIVLFKVLCGWRHPSRNSRGGPVSIEGIGAVSVPIEVADKFNGKKDSAGYGEERWSPREEFQFKGDPSAELQLKRIVYRMIALERSEGYSAPGEALKDFEKLSVQIRGRIYRP